MVKNNSNSILNNRNLRREIVQRINKVIDIPYLNERHEAQLISIVVDMCFNALSNKTMPSTNKQRGIVVEEEGDDDKEEVIAIPEGDSEEDVKEKMVREINEKFNMPMLNEEQEATMIRYFVDMLFQIKGEDDKKESA